MTLLVCWLVFPLVLAGLALGSGLLLDRLASSALPGALLLPSGLAVIVVAAQLATLTDATAELATPVVVGLAVAGFGLSLPPRQRKVSWAPAVAATGVFAAFAAPIVLSGEATFAGYIKLDDTSTFLALTDRVLEHGRSLEGLSPSTYEAALDINLGNGYPVGSLLPLGIGAALVGHDVAWVFQPYLAFLAAMLALALYALAARAIESRRFRVAAVFVAAQPALLYAYSLWGGIKELAAAATLALAAALAALVSGRTRAVVPLAVATAAALAILSAGGTVWLLPALAAAFVWRARATAAGGVLALVLSFPALLSASAFLRASNVDSFTTATELGNLIEPLSPLQLVGVWPVGDFRLEPDPLLATHVLIGVVAAASVAGLEWARRRRAWGLLIYAGCALLGALVYGSLGSPWVEAKAFATAAPALVLAAFCGCAALVGTGRRVEAAVATAAIAAGVLWSNLLAYREVNLAPRSQLTELEEIGERFSGQGPALMTEYQPYGVRHFLRDLDPEGASELRRRFVPLRAGGFLGKGEFADVDQFALDGLLVYRTLVLRRSPVASRPPSVYGLVWEGRYYEVWQRPAPALSPILEHLPLGDPYAPATRPSCREVRRLEGLAGVGRLAAVGDKPAITIHGNHVRVPRQGRYLVWLGGSFRRRVEVAVDGRVVATARHRLNNAGHYEPLGEIVLGAGSHQVALRYGDATLRPGVAGPAYGFGPLVLSMARPSRPVEFVAPGSARLLCTRELDWIEALP